MGCSFYQRPSGMAEEDEWVTQISTRTRTRKVDRNKADQAKEGSRSRLLARVAVRSTVARNPRSRAKGVHREASRAATAEVR
jgi:hypothetical protein